MTLRVLFDKRMPIGSLLFQKVAAIPHYSFRRCLLTIGEKMKKYLLLITSYLLTMNAFAMDTVKVPTSGTLEIEFLTAQPMTCESTISQYANHSKQVLLRQNDSTDGHVISNINAFNLETGQSIWLGLSCKAAQEDHVVAADFLVYHKDVHGNKTLLFAQHEYNLNSNPTLISEDVLAVHGLYSVKIETVNENSIHQ